jgi:hypothetical protein
MPLREHEGGPACRRHGLAGDERPLDLVREAADGDFPGPRHPCRRRRLADDREHRERPDRRQRAGAVGVAEGGRFPRPPFERDQRAGLPGRHAEPLADVAGRGAVPEREVEPPVEEDAEEAAGLPVDPLHGTDGRAEALVEVERAEAVERLGERLDVGRQGFAHRGPVDVRRRDFVGIGQRRRRRARRRPGVVDRGLGGEPLGGDGLGGLRLRERRPRHAPRQLDGLAPEPPDAPRAAEAEAYCRLCVVVRIGRASLRPDERREGARGPAAGPLEPLGLGRGGGDAGEEPDLRPRERTVPERGTEQRSRPSRDTTDARLWSSRPETPRRSRA